MKIVGLQPRDKVVMSRGLNNKIFFSKNLHENRVLILSRGEKCFC